MARGTRDFGEGQEPIGNDQLQDLLQSRARSLQGYALAIGLALTAILFFFPHPFP